MYHHNEYVPVDDAVKADLAFLKEHNKGEFLVGSRTDADDKWLVTFGPVTAALLHLTLPPPGPEADRAHMPRPEPVDALLVAIETVDIPHPRRAVDGQLPD